MTGMAHDSFIGARCGPYERVGYLLVAISGMHAMPTYLDAYDLAAILAVSPSTILRRAQTRPWSLPPPVHLGPKFPLRWRGVDVSRWLSDEFASTLVARR